MVVKQQHGTTYLRDPSLAEMGLVQAAGRDESSFNVLPVVLCLGHSATPVDN